MSERAQRLSRGYLATFATLIRTTPLTRQEIGNKSLAEFIRALVDECETLTFKASTELYEIAQELENLSDNP